MKAKKGVYRVDDEASSGNTTWFWLNSTVAQHVAVGAEILLSNGIRGVVEKKGFWGWKLKSFDGSIYTLSRRNLEGSYWLAWISEQPDI